MKKKKVDTINLVIAAAITAALAITVQDCLAPSSSEAVSSPSLASDLIEKRQNNRGPIDQFQQVSDLSVEPLDSEKTNSERMF
ncbi:MAG: hypothetical protein K2Z81_15175 [Cyanobacteria bacterium]|nr:hypothetical protein [Cyanobacteriota bacterium]